MKLVRWGPIVRERKKMILTSKQFIHYFPKESHTLEGFTGIFTHGPLLKGSKELGSK